MPWLATLDAKSRLWPAPLGRLYVSLKWALIVLGAWALSRVVLDRFGIWPL